MHPVKKVFHARPRLMLGLVAGIAATALLPGDYRPGSRALIGWDIAVWTYLLSVWFLMARAGPARVRAIAEREDENAGVILAVICVAAVTSLGAIVFELATSRLLQLESRLLHYAFTALTVLGSWCLVMTMFALHYARMFYGARSDAAPLRFPDRIATPDYWDFLYFSSTIAVAAQTSDVAVMSRPMRKVVMAQSVLSFLFNAAILGLSVNIAAGLVGT
ncbi:MAG TPA: DUF1345 domain-containing protein [Paucimonas sp.]|nr:DUF1345 domain-containing protein [Paucimonas sp.]HJW56323.1 DUF1345 domain-containing protein [Burkholderiaceae bacterium]